MLYVILPQTSCQMSKLHLTLYSKLKVAIILRNLEPVWFLYWDRKNYKVILTMI